jgi:small-conductance mechanosensitive channel
VDDSLKIFDFIRVGGLVTSVVVLAVTWLLGALMEGFLTRLGARFTGRRLVIHQVGTLTRFAVLLVGIAAAVLLSFDLSKEAILALSGTLAVAVGFALKDLAASVVAGLTILIDKPFQVGDRVSFGGYYGEITSIGLRSVRLTTLDDNVVTIPNNKFLTEAVSSGNAGALDMLIQMDFFVGLDQDVALAKRLVADAITSSRYAFLDKPWVVLLSHVCEGGHFAARLRAKVYVLDVRYEKALESDVAERVTAAFAEAGVQPPAMLHRTLPAHLAASEGAAVRARPSPS